MKTNRDAGLRGRRNDLGEAISGIARVDPCVTAWARQHPVIPLVAAHLKNRVLRVAEAGCAQVGLWLSAAAIRLFHVHKGIRPERHQLIVLALYVPILKARKLLFQSSNACLRRAHLLSQRRIRGLQIEYFLIRVRDLSEQVRLDGLDRVLRTHGAKAAHGVKHRLQSRDHKWGGRNGVGRNGDSTSTARQRDLREKQARQEDR